MEILSNIMSIPIHRNLLFKKMEHLISALTYCISLSYLTITNTLACILCGRIPQEVIDRSPLSLNTSRIRTAADVYRDSELLTISSWGILPNKIHPRVFVIVK